MRADVLFTSTVSDGAAPHQDEKTLSGKRAMIESAQRGIVLVDHARFYWVALHGLAPISDFDPVFVVPGVDESHLDELRERSIPFEVAPL